MEEAGCQKLNEFFASNVMATQYEALLLTAQPSLVCGLTRMEPK